MTQTVYGSVTQKASYFSYFFTVTAVPNTEGNFSDVTVSHYWQTGNTSYSFDTYSERAASITIEEETFGISKRFNVGTKWANGNPYLIQTATKRICHDGDGTKKITVSTRANGRASSYGPSDSSDSSGDCTASAQVTLDTIPRASSFTITPNVICVLPGGLGGVASIRASKEAMDAIRFAWENGKYVAAICAGPTVLADLGITENCQATCYPGCESGMGSASIVPGAACVQDGRLITGTSAGCAVPFGLGLIAALKGEEAAKTVAEQIVIR